VKIHRGIEVVSIRCNDETLDERDVEIRKKTKGLSLKVKSSPSREISLEPTANALMEKRDENGRIWNRSRRQKVGF
jgi:hypothetical protein